MDSDRTLTQKIVLWALLAMAVAFTAVNIILKFFPGVAFEDTLLKVEQNGDQITYTGKQHGVDITIAAYPEESGHVVRLTIGDSIDHIYHVEYPGGTISGRYGGTYRRVTVSRGEKVLFDGGYNPEPMFADYCELDGEMAHTIYMRPVHSGDPWRDFELHFAQVMSFANGPESTTRGSWLHYGMALFFSIICAVAVAFPYTLFELRYHWSVKDPEPTDFYLRTNEVVGAVVAGIILIVYIVGVTKIV